MDIVVIRWKIKPGRENREAFFKYWAGLKIAEDSGLVGEFLCRPLPPAEAGPKFSIFGADESVEYQLYFNVGIWNSLDAFRAAVDKYINGDPAVTPFLFAPPCRMALSPERSRRGDAQLPDDDHLAPL